MNLTGYHFKFDYLFISFLKRTARLLGVSLSPHQESDGANELTREAS